MDQPEASSGGGVIVAQYIGSRNKRGADRAAASDFRIAALVSLICMALMLVLDWSLKALLDIMRFRSGKWKGYQLI